MLTKDLLRYKIRGKNIFPLFIDPNKLSIRDLAGNLHKIYEKSIGLNEKELSEIIDESQFSGGDLLPAFKKLLDDRCEFEEDAGTIEAFRKNLIFESQRLRKEKVFEKYGDFQDYFAVNQKLDFLTIREKIYSDLPEYRRILNFNGFGAEILPHRYNCALIQGLLLRAKNLRIFIEGTTVTQRRFFFNMLKFNRLFADILENRNEVDFSVEISGPLAIFDLSKAYGIRLANFFPYILHLAKWRIEAEVDWSLKKYVLDVSSDRIEIKSHYSKKEFYIPEEFGYFIESFNKISEQYSAGWSVKYGEGIVNFGGGFYIIPDFTFQRGGSIVHMELFHRWHANQLAGRLKKLAKEPINNNGLVIGICKSLKNSHECTEMAGEAEGLGAKVFWFNNMPTPKVVLSKLS
ncbi:MAG: DUF790 family protein [Oligoflexales bacterium]|nr:DUF790 family protein [Oligoflexales bacterium]